jgi:hypothetical protein
MELRIPKLSHFTTDYFIAKRADGISDNTVEDYGKAFAHFEQSAGLWPFDLDP